MIPKTIHYCWFGNKPISRDLRMCMDTWKKILPDYSWRKWSEKDFDMNTTPWTKEAYEAHAMAFVADTATEGEVLPESLTVKVESKDVSDVATVFTFALDEASQQTFGKDMAYTFEQTQECVTNGIAVQKYGAMIIPASKSSASVDLVVNIGGTKYTSTAKIDSTSEVGATFTLSK